MIPQAPLKQSWWRSFGLPLLAIPLGGLIMIGLTLALYVGLYLGLESLFFADNPQGFPVGPLRTWSTIALVGLYLVLARARLPELLKAILLTGPVAASIITTGHALYSRPLVSIAGMLTVAAVCAVLLYRFKKPWFYYDAAGLAALIGLAYAWPRPELNEPQLSYLAWMFPGL